MTVWKIRSSVESYCYDVGSSNQVLWDNVEGRDSVRGERQLQEGGRDLLLPVADSC